MTSPVSVKRGRRRRVGIGDEAKRARVDAGDGKRRADEPERAGAGRDGVRDHEPVADGDVQRVRGALRDQQARPGDGQRAGLERGAPQRSIAPEVSSDTSTRRSPAISVEGSRSDAWVAPTLCAAATLRDGRAVGAGRRGQVDGQAAWAPASASLRLVDSVLSKESMTPDSAITIVTTAPMPGRS